jgi:GNAT superfamily N-acetyltransferase
VTIAIAPLAAGDRAAWEALARGYHAFYENVESDARYAETWRQLIEDQRLHGLAAWIDDRMVGIAHFLFLPQTWSNDACYLQDLFTAEDARGNGVATALIDAVAGAARLRGAAKYYWLTRDRNLRARALYDRIARFKGFLRYDYPL